jgi:hypothetical protein
MLTQATISQHPIAGMAFAVPMTGSLGPATRQGGTRRGRA